jgi:nucleotide-binding universal stress UspA family protein
VIVMGTHGRRGLAHLLLGSVAEKVVRQADVPVITVRSDADGEAPDAPKIAL